MKLFFEKLKLNSEKYEYHKIEGNHLLHMTNPEETAGLITKFIQDESEPRVKSLDSFFDNLHHIQSV